MKKALVIIVALSLVALVPLSALADATTQHGIITFGTGGGQTCSYGLSNNVYMTYTSANTGQDYALGDKHLSGNREFYTTNVSTNIYYYEDNNYKGKSTLSNAAQLLPGSSTLSGTPL